MDQSQNFCCNCQPSASIQAGVCRRNRGSIRDIHGRGPGQVICRCGKVVADCTHLKTRFLFPQTISLLAKYALARRKRFKRRKLTPDRRYLVIKTSSARAKRQKSLKETSWRAKKLHGILLRTGFQPVFILTVHCFCHVVGFTDVGRSMASKALRRAWTRYLDGHPRLPVHHARPRWHRARPASWFWNKKPANGDNVQLTIDLGLQKHCRT